MSTSSDYTAIAQNFATFYYQMYSANRASLAQLYRANSMMTFEGTQIMGVQNIMERLNGLPQMAMPPTIDTLDTQPTGTTGSILVCVTGRMQLDPGMPDGIRFSETFHLVPEGGNYFVHNDIFRLNYG
jgi:hypothetical protein